MLCFCLPALASVQSIYNRLVKANGLKQHNINVMSGVYDQCSLACTDFVNITITTELLSQVRNEDELAGVIGHEMAHAVYHDSELKADVLGLQYAAKAGYNYCKAAQFLKNFLADADHPSGAVRYKNTGCK